MIVCAGQKSGGEAAIHAMRNIFEADETDAALLVDASNAFNSLNRAAALNNNRVLCPLIATYVTNTYRAPALDFSKSTYDSLDYLEFFDLVKFIENNGLPAI